jgi:hypothetical protein
LRTAPALRTRTHTSHPHTHFARALRTRSWGHDPSNPVSGQEMGRVGRTDHGMGPRDVPQRGGTSSCARDTRDGRGDTQRGGGPQLGDEVRQPGWALRGGVDAEVGVTQGSCVDVQRTRGIGRPQSSSAFPGFWGPPGSHWERSGRPVTRERGSRSRRAAQGGRDNEAGSATSC